MADNQYDIIAVGTGFASSFFLHRFLAKTPRPLRVLVLEAGKLRTHSDQLTEGNPMRVAELRHERASREFVNKTPEKTWRFFTGFGGGSNCWVACTPRLIPEDFELKTRYGIGEDWPISYDDLEPYYCDAEDLMQVSGDSDHSPVARSRPFPQTAHRMSAPEKLLAKAFPDQIFSHPAARSTGPVPGQRGACCNSGVCQLCPVDAKFTILNGMKAVYDNTSVELKYNAKVVGLEYTGNTVSGVRYRDDKGETTLKADLVVLGANAMFNPHIMLRSGIEHPQLGAGLCEQVSRSAFIRLDGVDNFSGGTISNALGYHSYGGEHRKNRAAALLQTINAPTILNVRGRWLQQLRVNFIYEDFRLTENRVSVSSEDVEKPEATHLRRSELTNKGLESIEDDLAKILPALPTIDYEIEAPWRTDSHIMGTTVMGDDPQTSVVDSDCIHHRLRNLLVLGSGTFPTAAPANPTLTISALSLRAADRMLA